MFYKVIKNNKVIDVLSSLTYVRKSPASSLIVLCSQKDASGILSSDGNTIWHLRSYKPFGVGDYETVDIALISKEEYHQLKALNGKSPEEIIDEYTLSLLEGGLI